MIDLQRVKRNGQITLPKALREAAVKRRFGEQADDESL